MDKKDEKILAELVINSRTPFSRLGKKVGMSREVVTYRVNKLIKEKIITDFYPIINTEALGYFRNGCCIQLKDIDEVKERVFFSFLKEHHFVTYVGAIIGKWNVAFDILSKNREHLIKIIQEIINEAGKHIENYIVTNNSVQEEIYPTKVIGIVEKTKHFVKSKEIKLDETDKNVLALLSVNSRVDYIELSSKLHLTANAIKYRIKQLEDCKIIRGYTIFIDATKLGYEYYNLQIKLNSHFQEDILKSFFRNHPRIIYFYKYLGNENWDIDIGILAKNSHGLREIIMELRKEFGNIMRIQDVYSTFEVIKADITPAGIFI
ncbi:MAG: Lrp/AsnC family transcriptional regulator [Nanoarchaeota archaeon]